MEEPSQPKTKSWLPTVERGCCCSLKVCCLIQGVLSVFSSVIDMTKTTTHLLQASACEELKRRGEICRMQEDSFSDLAPKATLGTGETIFLLIVEIFVLITAVLFIVAIIKDAPRLMLPYIYTMTFAIGAGVFLAACILLVAPVLAVFLVLLLALPAYVVICANSLRIQMEDRKRIPNPVDDL